MESENISGNGLAQKSGISQKTIWVIQGGKSQPTLVAADAIAKALGLDCRTMMSSNMSAAQIGRSGRTGRMLDKLLQLSPEQLAAVDTVLNSFISDES
jgi:transcriptional regulator with XRE-family HTH domain